MPSASGTWTVTQSGNNLILNYVAVPEPTSLAILTCGAVPLGILGRRRK